MPPDLRHLPPARETAGPGDAGARITALNARFRHHGATTVIAAALKERVLGRIALVSSFGAESVALLHLVAMVNRATPVLFIDTEMLFTETLVYQQELAERLGLQNLTILRVDAGTVRSRDPSGTLHREDPDACCGMSKTAPLHRALRHYDGWLTGRKRFQSGTRAQLEFFEHDPATRKFKINPLAHWAPQDVQTYIDENRLPRHPLVARGYPSIGCAPCTSRVSAGEDPRAGRWRGRAKQECGIHFVDGRPVRIPQNT